MKKCSGCKKLKSIENFSKDRNRKDGFQQWCKQCHKNYYNTPKGKFGKRKYLLKHDFNLTPKEHSTMYITQKGCCAICKKQIPYSKMHTDHNHLTGKVRGLLCRRCNGLLAGIEDKDFFESAIKYLEKYNDIRKLAS